MPALCEHYSKSSTHGVLFIAPVAVTRAAFGQGTGPLFLCNVRCTGTESSLLRCSHQVVGITPCSHSNDAGVVCSICKLICT